MEHLPHQAQDTLCCRPVVLGISGRRSLARKSLRHPHQTSSHGMIAITFVIQKIMRGFPDTNATISIIYPVYELTMVNTVKFRSIFVQVWTLLHGLPSVIRLRNLRGV